MIDPVRALSRLTQAQNGESGTVQYSYDNAGNLLQRSSSSGKTTTLACDALHHLTSKTYSDGRPAVSYSYDSRTANGIGQLGSVVNASGTANFTAFDAVGNVLQQNQQTAGRTYAFSYAYNLAGGLVSETYPSGRVVTTSYDGANRPAQVAGTMAGLQTVYLSGMSLRRTVRRLGTGMATH